MKATAPLLAVAVVTAAVVAALARREPAAAPPSYEPVRAPGAAWAPGDAAEGAPATSLRGKVLEVIDVAEYTYLRLATSAGEQWTAVAKTRVEVGSTAQVLDASRMEDFASPTLGRTFPLIYFGRLGDGVTASQDLPPGHPAVPAQGASSPHHGSPPPASSALAEVPVPPARGKDAHVIADLYASRDQLRGRVVRVSGQVMKVTSGVLGKNYLRIRDGSSAKAEQRELVVTTLASTEVGAVVTVKGTLQADVDVGIGYSYPVLLADAELLPSP
ncbi:MAG: hypothetical protein K0R38_2880 [Polyangiaceae bacterium]|jgi:hypothetical protein|nr:hypothetical protein [Polyangiaceae bacterium]